ncbi:IS66 family insertion sequence element accessory protein TnpA [Alteromonas sp. 14N.309.X.WAT.G.H12]|uniref:IS66 family insertion sequence element accessory protein TnpA n=1 Tax=Alteromonas sp. 14N.309.X.WAT.G.H12 TaxID=3120824 RepID=UPI002FCE760D
MIRRSPQKWQQLIDAQEASDMTIAQFCHTHHINQSTFYLQRKKRKDLLLPQTTEQWLPIDTVASHRADNRQWQIELTLPNGVVLNMSTDG